MKPVDVIIIGGGVGGLTCAMTICSAVNKSWFGKRRVHIIDDGQSDLSKAQLYNAPGVAIGASGTETLEHMRRQVDQYQIATFHQGSVVAAKRAADHWTLHLQDDRIMTSQVIVMATGYKRWELQGLPDPPIRHPRGGKADRIMLEHDGVYRIEDGLYVAGLLGGGSSQFAIAAGIGAQVGVEILSLWAGKRTHVHDVPNPSDTPPV